jgi:hypothetical protein
MNRSDWALSVNLGLVFALAFDFGFVAFAMRAALLNELFDT